MKRNNKSELRSLSHNGLKEKYEDELTALCDFEFSKNFDYFFFIYNDNGKFIGDKAAVPAGYEDFTPLHGYMFASWGSCVNAINTLGTEKLKVIFDDCENCGCVE